MIALKQRSAQDGVDFHRTTPARVYENDIQKFRVDAVRSLIEKTPAEVIVELGCGTADITGPLSNLRTVYGYDCNDSARVMAKRRFPNMNLGDTIPEPFPCDCIVLSEFLEHIPQPLYLVGSWLNDAQYSVISHPLNEIELGADISDGEHQWSFDLEDFKNWFEVGHHDLLEYRTFKLGMVTFILGLGKHK